VQENAEGAARAGRGSDDDCAGEQHGEDGGDGAEPTVVV
jgi:hypothetical protein